MLPDQRERHTRRLRRLGWLGIALIPAVLFFALRLSAPKLRSSAQVAARLDSICAREGMEDGTPWDGSGEPAGRAFALRLGEMLFGQGDPLTAWTCYDTVPQAKAAGLRIGDILCTPGHASVIYAVGRDGEIRTVECEGSGEHLIRRGGFYLNDPGNTDFQHIIDRCGFECLLTAPDNLSPVVWSGRLAALPEEPCITGAAYPTVLSNGQSFGLRGTVSCRHILTRLRAVVSDRTTGTVIFDVAVEPNDNVYTIGSPVTEPINEGLVFNSPACANSWLNYRLTAVYDRDGTPCTAVLLDQDLRVGSPVTGEPES